ncbi:N-formylglutamate amidohydrolase [Terasakiella sp. A23]|uniref:N-formylglutamate amidohydrolase n=1 Tax=Terasakiella sp. FCG-A23 TaxID=3080561 RepID=UPI0029533A3E|nr:N-formylglutamate amidohydrolase [Terasakiella sp. A23]MDV7340660.1 N-formylglutamate amidohydrolase [Terasakiella sp. A23]
MAIKAASTTQQETETRDAIDAPFNLLRPKSQSAPVIYASPHSGDHYPRDFIKSSLLDPIALRRSEDAFVHEIYESCLKFGSPLLKANFPRAYVDPNREPFELDPSMFDEVLPSFVNIDSVRALAGLGTVAKVVTNGANIYRDKLKFAEVRQRIERLYHPYHAALRQMIDDTCAIFGGCLLIDCHSMPSIGGPMDQDNGNNRTDIILGDRFGTSCAEWISDLAQQILEDQGFVVKRNRPYAGGYTTYHYGNPKQHVHTLQIELNRVLYMNEENITRLPELQDVKRRIRPLIEELSAIDARSL